MTLVLRRNKKPVLFLEQATKYDIESLVPHKKIPVHAFHKWNETVGHLLENIVENIAEYFATVSLAGYSLFVNKPVMLAGISEYAYGVSTNVKKKSINI